MKPIFKIAENTFFEGLYKMRDPESNYAYPFDFPTILSSKEKSVRSGNYWSSCTCINTPVSIVEIMTYQNPEYKGKSLYDVHYPNLNESENYELNGLIFALASIAESYEVFRFGNYGTSGKGTTDIRNIELAKSIFESSKIPVNRANELIEKIGRF